MAYMLDQIPLRHRMIFLVGVSLMITSSLQELDYNVWVALVARKDFEFTPYVPGAYSCPYSYSEGGHATRNKEGVFQWEWGFMNSVDQLLLWIEVICELPSGVWADLYGGHRLLLWSLGLSSVLRLLTPFSVALGEEAYVLTRLLSQVCLSPARPASISLIAHWAEPRERTTVSAVLLIFDRIGWFFPGSPRWPVQLYCGGVVGLLAAALWWATGRRWHDARLRSGGAGPAKRVPLARMVTAPPLLRLCLLSVAEATTYTGQDAAQSFLNEALTRTMPFAGIALFFASLLISFAVVYAYAFTGVASDRLVSAGLIGLPTARRVFSGVGSVGAASSILLLAAAGCDPLFVLGCRYTYGFFCAWQQTVLTTSVLDSAPCLAGTLLSLTGISTALSARAIDRVVGRMTGSWRTRGDSLVWSGVFLMFAVLNLVPTVPYLVLGPFVELPWARRPSLDAQPNTFKAWILHLILSMTGIILFCVFVIFVSIWL